MKVWLLECCLEVLFNLRDICHQSTLFATAAVIYFWLNTPGVCIHSIFRGNFHAKSLHHRQPCMRRTYQLKAFFLRFLVAIWLILIFNVFFRELADQKKLIPHGKGGEEISILFAIIKPNYFSGLINFLPWKNCFFILCFENTLLNHLTQVQ